MKMWARSTLACLWLAANTAAAHSADPQAGDDPAAPDPICEEFSQLSADTDFARKGATLGLRPERFSPYYGSSAIPDSCITEWEVEPAGAGEVSMDAEGQAVLTVFATEGEEQILRVTGRVGLREASVALPIIEADEAVLLGFWRQESAECDDGAPVTPVGELRFWPDGDFSITYRPFESYVDYRGPAEFDAGSGRLRLIAVRGNRLPAWDEILASASFEGVNTLSIEGVDFGGGLTTDPSPRPGCAYVFVR
jgi:hypothetical protein